MRNHFQKKRLMMNRRCVPKVSVKTFKVTIEKFTTVKTGEELKENQIGDPAGNRKRFLKLY
jgi:hypothetical protein